MRMRPRSVRVWILVAALLSGLLTCGTAQARRRATVAVLATGITLGAVGLASLGIAAGLYYGSPSASTLELFERYNNVSSNMLYPGVIGLLLGAPFGVAGSLMWMHDSEQDARQAASARPVSLWVLPTGTGLALGGRF